MTPKQEAFCQAIADGKNQSDAYRLAYNAANMNPNTVNRKAHDLMNDGNITARIKELRDKLQERVLITREGVLQAILETIEIGKLNGKPMEIYKGYEIINKMLGYDAPQKIEVESKKNIADLSDEELQAICDGFIDREIEERQRVK
jgi:phage terminase small subunit